MFPKIRLVNGRAITVGSLAAGLRAALVTGAEKLVGHTEELKRHYRNVAREASNASVSVASAPTSPPGREGATSSLGASPRVSSDTAPWAASKHVTEVDRVHDSDQTVILWAAWALFETCSLPPGFSMRFGKLSLRKGLRHGGNLKYIESRLC